jgi:hypothetical protein
MRTECGNQYPERRAVACDKTTPNHRLCSGYDTLVGDFVDWENPSWTPPKTMASSEAAKTTLKAMAARVDTETGLEGAERAAGSWSPAQRLVVESVISEVAEQQTEFTTDDIWAALPPGIPKTKGLAGMLIAASKKKLITATDRYADSRRTDRADHDHGRRLRIWRRALP